MEGTRCQAQVMLRGRSGSVRTAVTSRPTRGGAAASKRTVPGVFSVVATTLLATALVPRPLLTVASIV